MYFCGLTSQDQLVYLDPHTTQFVSEPTDTESYFCRELRLLGLDKICPALGVGFYLKNLGALNEFKTLLDTLKTSPISVITDEEATVQYDDAEGDDF